MPNEPKTETIEDAQIIWRNFEGRKVLYNERGDRNFSVVLDKPLADRLATDHWNVKCRIPDEDAEEDAEPFCHLQVKVAFANRPPTIVMISPTSGTRTYLNEDNVNILDSADIRHADLIIREYRWDVNGKQGVKAYLQSLYVTLEEDDLYRKYNTNEDSSPPGEQEE